MYSNRLVNKLEKMTSPCRTLRAILERGVKSERCENKVSCTICCVLNEINLKKTFRLSFYFISFLLKRVTLYNVYSTNWWNIEHLYCFYCKNTTEFYLLLVVAHDGIRKQSAIIQTTKKLVLSITYFKFM